MKTKTPEQIPTESDWLEKPDTIYESYKFELNYMRGRFQGKTWKDINKDFFWAGSSIERAYELTYAPPRIFRYYVQSFAAYVLSNEAKGDADAASTFLRMIENRLGGDYQSILDTYDLLGKCVDFIGSNQEWFEAPSDIYGKFSDNADRIRKIVSFFQKGGKPPSS